MKGIVLTVVTLSFYQCMSQDLALPITINIKVDKEYELTKKKEFYSAIIQENGFVVNSDSVTQKYYDVSLVIQNSSSKSISIWLMNCSYEENFLINNNYIYGIVKECFSNYPIRVEFKPGASKTYKFTLARSIKFDYPCQDCAYGQQVETTKLGLIVIDDIFDNKLKATEYDLGMEDKSKWRVIWSNSLHLLDK